MSSSVKERSLRAPVVGSHWLARAIVVVLLLGAVVGVVYWLSASGGKVLTQGFSEPLNGAKAARVGVETASGHLAIDGLAGGEQVLASGTLQYLEQQGAPRRSVSLADGQATLKVDEGSTGQSWLNLPWAACGGTYEWQIHLNPTVQSDILAHSGGGNIRLSLAGMAVSRVSADTGGGNVDVTLPDNAAGLTATARTGGGNVTVEVGNGIAGSNSVDARSGAGNVVVRVPSGVATRIHATTGLGKVIVDPRLSQVDGDTYQSPGYDGAVNRIEVTVHSGAGNVSVSTK